MRLSKSACISIFPLLFFTGAATAEDISGTMAVTKTVLNDSRLVGDITCTMVDSACIAFGAPGIKLSLNGFAITGPANPDDSSTCNPTSGAPLVDLISTNNQIDVQILGPGMVQKARRHGIFVPGTAGVSTRVTVKQVTSSHNCYSGLLMSAVSDSVIEGIVSFRNAANSGAASCGGNCLVSSNNNHVWKSQFSGNGSVCPTATCTAATATAGSNNDFGVGLVGTSNGNLIEGNSITGNTNGVLVQAGASGNVVRQNIVVGNPPVQVSRDYGPIGSDIKDESVTNGARNFLSGNQCVSYSGPGPAPCPSFPVSDPATMMNGPVNAPSANGITFNKDSVNVGASFTATFSFSGSTPFASGNLTDKTYFDVRVRPPNSTTDIVSINWQQGMSATHAASTTTQTGNWTVTGIRAHADVNDAAGPFAPVSVTLTVIP